MEVKKSPKADLENKKGLFLQIGMVVSLGLMIALFNYSQSEKTIDDLGSSNASVQEEQIENIKEPEKPIDQPKQALAPIADVIKIVSNTTVITNKMDFTEFDPDASIVAPVAPVVEDSANSDEIFMVLEDKPTFNGGDLAVFRKWVQDKFVYPAVASENGIQGTVTLKFVVERNGTLSNIEVLASPDRSLSEEAIRVLKTSPKWEPAKQRGKAVRFQYTLPVVFRIE